MLALKYSIENDGGATFPALCVICGLTSAACKQEDSGNVVPITAHVPYLHLNDTGRTFYFALGLTTTIPIKNDPVLTFLYIGIERSGYLNN